MRDPVVAAINAEGTSRDSRQTLDGYILMQDFERVGTTETRSASTSWDYLSGKADLTASGMPVSPHLAENLSAVFACVQAISETVASLPLLVYRSEGDGRFADPQSPVARLFARGPNSLQTAPEFFEMMTAHCLLRGNSYAEIVRDNRGAPVELIPIHPDHISVVRFPGSRRIAFDYSDPNTGGTRRLLQEECLHLKDRSDDGVVGKSRLQRARETFGTALASEHFAARTFKNGATLSGVLTHPSALPDAAYRRLKNQFQKAHSGTDNAARTLILEEGMTWSAVSVSPRDAEMLASRAMGVVNIARIYLMPPPIIGDLQGGNYSSLIELGRWFYDKTIRPWLNKWERTIERALFSEEGRRTHEVEFDTDHLLRGDLLKLFQTFRIGREIGLYSANDLRRFQNLNPRTDAEGDAFLSPMNMSAEQTGAPKD